MQTATGLRPPRRRETGSKDRRVLLQSLGFDDIDFTAEGLYVVVFNTEVDVGSLPVGAAQLWEFDLNGCVETGLPGDR